MIKGFTLYRVHLLTTVYTMWVVVIIVLCEKSSVGAALLVHKYSTRIVRTKYGPLRGIMIHIHPPVEAFLGVPYATPPVGSLRYMPPVTPSLWRSTRLADQFGSVCPQRLPDISNRSEALLDFPKSRLLLLEKLLPLLSNQSEDCLYLNLYVPRLADNEEESTPLPCLVYIHGESFEWNSGNPYDGTVLASTGKIIVVTINFRLGVLGFLKTGSKGSAQGNFGLMDLIAGLHWLRENLEEFGGDPHNITVMGHGTGAALANFIAVSPVAKELFHRVILISGSSLSPWALQRDPLWVKRSVAKHTNCHGDLHEDDLAPCLRQRPLSQLMSVRLDSPRFLPGFAPFVDGTILVNPTGAPPTPSGPSQSSIPTFSGMELADFPDRDLLFGLTSVESFLDLNAQDLQFGFNETKRDRILRTYVRNSYYFHLNEIFSTLKNEYTDWERPTQNPLGVRDATLSVLSDGHTAAPLIRLGYLHSIAGGKTFFLHFRHHNEGKDFPQNSNSVRGEDIPYILGLPVIGGGSFFPHNYSHTDAQISKTVITYLSNFVRRGDPNTVIPYQENFAQERSSYNIGIPFWDTYDNINQFYLEIASRPVKKDHYRGHKMSLWLNLIPQLHRPREDDDVSMRHHHFLEEDEQYYDGFVRPQMKEKPAYVHILAPPPVPTTTTTTTTTTQTTTSNLPLTLLPPKSDTALQATTTECPPNTTAPSFNRNADNIIRRIASGHYQSYTTALTITIAVGCFLVLLNVLIFIGIYHQRERGKKEEKRKEVFAETGSCSSSSGETYKPSCEQQLQPFSYDGMGATTLKSCQTYVDPTISYKHAQEEEMTQFQLQEFSSSPMSAKRIERRIHSYPDVTSTTPAPPTPAVQKVDCCSGTTDDSPPGTGRGNGNTGSGVAFPLEEVNQTGILRPHGMPMTPGTVKKRVQIQEISV